MRTLQNNSSTVKNFKFTDNAFLPKEVIIPLVQENDITLKSLVKPGDVVTEGQIIAVSDSDSDGKPLCPIHSSVPGTVEEIISSICPNGKIQESIKIKFKGSFSFLGKKITEKKWIGLDSSLLKKQILDSGILNTFLVTEPESLGSQLDNKDTLVVRLYDEDILRVSDYLMYKFFWEKIRIGAQILAEVAEIKNIVYLLDDKVAALNSVNEKFFDAVYEEEDSDKKDDGENPHEKAESKKNVNEYVIKVKNASYPNGLKRDILNICAKYFKRNSEVSVTENSLFVDTYSLYDVYNAIVLGMPVMNRYVLISGTSMYTSCFINVKIGCTLRNLVDQLGGFAVNPETIVINGKITGNSVNSLDVPVSKYVKSIEFIAKTNFTDQNIYSCINCGDCRNVCPVGIAPDILYKHAVGKSSVYKEILSTVYLCNDCGLCNTVCQSRLPLSQMMSVLKKDL